MKILVRKKILAENKYREFAHVVAVDKFIQRATIVSMKKKPVIITLLSVLCFIEPLIKVLYFKVTTKFDFIVIFANLQMRNSFLEVVDFWLVFPFAGLLILKLRKWTYFSFLALLCYINYSIFTYEKFTWPYNSDSPFLYDYFISIGSIAIFVYFLNPKVRGPFFDRRLRWWEPKNRYHVNISCKLQGSHLTFPSQILNISQSGAFVSDSSYLKIGERLVLEFHFLGQTLSLPAEVINRHTYKNQAGFGLKFNFRSFKQSVTMVRVIKVLKKSQRDFKAETNMAA
jgi:hypothetical protein